MNGNLKNSKTNKNKIPGWTILVKESQERANFWNSIWKSAGKPLNTELHKIAKKTKNEYHYQIRKCRKLETFIKNSKLIGGGLVFLVIGDWAVFCW